MRYAPFLAWRSIYGPRTLLSGRGKRIRWHALRRHGSIHLLPRGRGLRPSARLSQLRISARPNRPRVRLVICNTMVRHELANSAYNERREECERAVVLLSSVIEGVKALRDVTLAN